MTDHIFLYWDDLSYNTKPNHNGTKMGKSRDEVYESERREDSLLYMEGTRFKKPKVKRVDELYKQFTKLSQIEKHNFINLITNHHIHG